MTIDVEIQPQMGTGFLKSDFYLPASEKLQDLNWRDVKSVHRALGVQTPFGVFNQDPANGTAGIPVL